VQALVSQSGPFSTVWTIDTARLASKLQQGDALIRTVQMSRVLPHTLKVVVTYKDPQLVWITGNQPMLLDANGIAIAAAGTPLPSVPAVVDSSNLPVKPGDRVVTGGLDVCGQAFARAIAASQGTQFGGTTLL
jgi:cell division septal protein FtsQ